MEGDRSIKIVVLEDGYKIEFRTQQTLWANWQDSRSFDDLAPTLLQYYCWFVD
jgi:hypothetical protein